MRSSSPRPPARLLIAAAAAAALAAAGSGCTNPVRDAQIEALGPEPDGAPGPDHRPGQPCLLCHSEGGPASSKAFAMAGTIYVSDAPGAEGSEGVIVQFVDARGSGPVVAPSTGPTGNFYVPLQDWPNLSYPVRVALYAKIGDKPGLTMKSLINREGSCNFCHRPLPEGDLTEEQIDATRSSAGQLVFKVGS